MECNPIVSVIIPTYKRNTYLKRCLDSVYNQSYDNIEIIVIDDSGDEYARKVTEGYDLKYIPFETNRGPTAARNRGIEMASGKYIQLLDDDDLLEPTKIESQIRLLESESSVGVIYCAFEEDGVVTTPPSNGNGDVLKLTLKLDLSECITSAMLIDSKIFKQIAPLPETPGSDDTYWKIELAQKTEFDFIDEVLVRRLSPDQRRQSSWGAIKGTYSIIDHYADIYDKFPNTVRDRARSHAMRREAMYRASHSLWSIKAISLYLRSLRLDPHPSTMTYITLPAILLGKMSFIPARILYQSVSKI